MSVSEMFIADLAYSTHKVGDEIHGDLEVTPELRTPGSTAPRISVLATVADIHMGSLIQQRVRPRLALTLDLAAAIVRPTDADRLLTETTVLKVGSTASFLETRILEPAGTLIAVVHGTFVASPRPQDVIFPMAGGSGGFRPQGRLRRPIAEQLGIELVDRGVAELACGPYVLQMSGTLQGGAVVLLAEVAAESVLDGPVGSVSVHYLSTVRTGPARAVATRLGERTASVELRDTGNADRLASVTTAHLS